MGLFFLNISVDVDDPSPNFVLEDLTINDQESIIEIIIEQVLGYEQAIAEHDDNDSEDYGKLQLKVQFLPLSNYSTTGLTFKAFSLNNQFSDYHSPLSNGFYELNFPPPRV